MSKSTVAIATVLLALVLTGTVQAAATINVLEVATRWVIHIGNDLNGLPTNCVDARRRLILIPGVQENQRMLDCADMLQKTKRRRYRPTRFAMRCAM